MAQRLQLDLGGECNNNCIFCFLGDKSSYANLSTGSAKRKICEARENGANELVLTGGEPTIRKDLVDIVAYAKGLGYRLIQMQTNARLLCYRDYVDKLVRAGITEFVPAVHGHEAGLHDGLVRVPGAFEQTVKGIKNMVSKGVYMLTDTVIVKQNFKFLPEITEFLFNLGVSQVQLSFVHPIGNAYRNFEDVVPRISDVEAPLKKALKLAEKMEKPITTEGVPLCFLEGFENRAVEYLLPETEFENENMSSLRINQEKTKSDECGKCVYFKTCEGIWNEYSEKMGLEELKPKYINRNANYKHGS